VEYRRLGGLSVGATREQMAFFEDRVKREQEIGLDVRMVTPEEVLKLVPILAKENILGGTYCPIDGTANPIRASFAFARTAKALGAKIHTHTEVTGIELAGDEIKSVETTKGKMRGEIVVNATGPWAPAIGRMVGIDISIMQKRSQLIVTQQLPEAVCPLMMSVSGNQGYYSYYSQTLHGNVLLGLHSRPVEQYDRGVTFEGVSAQSFYTMKFLPSLGKVPAIRSFAGISEWTPDTMPIIGFVNEVRGFLIDAGYSGHGFCLGPISGKLVSELILEGKPSLSLDAFDYYRFQKGEAREVAVH
jgi:sarcosine oxidase subunit beta